MVELADALASGASGSNTVRVQVPPSAPKLITPLLAADNALVALLLRNLQSGVIRFLICASPLGGVCYVQVFQIT